MKTALVSIRWFLAVSVVVTLIGVASVRSAHANAYTFTTISVPGSSATLAYGVNNSGQIVGIYTDTNGVTQGFLYNSGTFTQVQFLGAQGTLAQGINDSGQIVGGYGQVS